MTETSTILKRMGFSFSESRFPFTYHHDRFRQGSEMSRSDVASSLRQKYRNDDIIRAVCEYEAILYLISEQPHLVNHELVDLLSEIKAKIPL
jgi:hypothetical protein